MAESLFSAELALSLHLLNAKTTASSDLENKVYSCLSSPRNTVTVKEQDSLFYYLDHSFQR